MAAPGAEVPDDVATRHFEAGRQLVDAGKLNEGVRELLAAHAASPQPPAETDFYLGMAYDSMGRADAAILAYRRFLGRSPGCINARNVRERLTLLESRGGQGAPAGEPAAVPVPRPAPERKGPFPPLRVNDPTAPAAPTAPPAGRRRADGAQPPKG